MTTKTIEYFFDFSSPYGYLGTLVVERLAQDIGRTLVWQPYLMGAAMKITGTPTLTDVPLKRDYTAIDLARHAKQLGVVLRKPTGFPIFALAACRIFYALAGDDPALAEAWCKVTARKAWGEGQNVSDPTVLADICAQLRIDPDLMMQKIAQQSVKDRLKQETQSAIERGIWGSPHFVIDGEDPYWGIDKRHEIKARYGVAAL